MQTQSFLKNWFLSINFENISSLNEDRDQSQSSIRRAVIGPNLEICKFKFFKVNRQQPNFQEWLFVYIIAFVKVHLKLSSVIFYDLWTLYYTIYSMLVYNIVEILYYMRIRWGEGTKFKKNKLLEIIGLGKH